MPPSISSASTLSISARLSTIPSLSAKPVAKSSMSAGLAIITAWVEPFTVMATGVSSGSARVISRRSAPRWASPRAPVATPRDIRPRLHFRRRKDAARAFPPARRSPFCSRSAPFESDTCTAVTLYSGQLVAQSE